APGAHEPRQQCAAANRAECRARASAAPNRAGSDVHEHGNRHGGGRTGGGHPAGIRPWRRYTVGTTDGGDPCARVAPGPCRHLEARPHALTGNRTRDRGRAAGRPTIVSAPEVRRALELAFAHLIADAAVTDGNHGLTHHWRVLGQWHLILLPAHLQHALEAPQDR